MAFDPPNFRVRESLGGYVIEAAWPDGSIEQIRGVYQTRDAATGWIAIRSSEWINQRRGGHD